MQGDVVRILNTSGATVVAYSYDAWGKCTVTTGASNAIANANPIRYRGYYYDTDTGFYYLQSRYYDPTIKRFISADTYINANGDILGFNMYAYCGNNPIINEDDFGTWYHVAIGAAIGGLLGALSTCASLIIENKLYEGDPSYIPHSTQSIIAQSIISGIVGAFSGAIGAIGGSPAVLAIADATLSATESVANSLISDICKGQDISWTELAVDATISVGTSLVFSATIDSTDGKMDDLFANYKTAKKKANSSSNPNAMKNFKSSSPCIRYKYALTKFTKETINEGFVGTMCSGAVSGYLGCVLP